MFVATERDDRRSWSVSEYRSSAGNFLDDSNTAIASSIASCQTRSSLCDRIFTQQFSLSQSRIVSLSSYKKLPLCILLYPLLPQRIGSLPLDGRRQTLAGHLRLLLRRVPLCRLHAFVDQP